MNNYFFQVLMPEFLTKIYMDLFSMDKMTAVGYMKSTPLRPENDF